MEQIILGKQIIEKLESNGYQAFFVGGFVRDLLLQRKINDIDIATNAHPESVMSIFSESIPTGLQYGTVTILVKGIPFEITTYRTEGRYLDYRRPSKVNFVSDLYEDLKRRDFSMNAIAMSKDGHIIDPFNGQKDLRNREIVAVGNPDDRFLEDPLRMLRAIRFVSQLNFTIEEKTMLGLRSNMSYIQNIAIERIKMEFDKIFTSEYPNKGVDLLIKTNILDWINGLNSIKAIGNTFINSDQLLETKDPIIRLMIFLNNFEANDRQYILKKLRYSKKEILKVNKVYLTMDMLKEGTANDIKRCLVTTDRNSCLSGIKLLSILGLISREEEAELIKSFAEIENALHVRSSKDLMISGRDLAEYFSRTDGPWIKEILDYLTAKVIYEEIPNSRKILLDQATKYIEGIRDDKQ